MKKSEVLSKISSDIWSSFYLDKIIPIKNQIKSCKDTLATMDRHQSTFDYKPYIVYHREIWDNYSEDLTVISEVSADLLKHQSELWETGKYDSVEFTVITYKTGCPEQDVSNFSWDDDNNDMYVVEWDIYDDLHKYGSLWALVATDKETADVKETLAYKAIQDQIVALEKDLINAIDKCGLFEED